MKIILYYHNLQIWLLYIKAINQICKWIKQRHYLHMNSKLFIFVDVFSQLSIQQIISFIENEILLMNL